MREAGTHAGVRLIKPHRGVWMLYRSRGEPRLSLGAARYIHANIITHNHPHTALMYATSCTEEPLSCWERMMRFVLSQQGLPEPMLPGE